MTGGMNIIKRLRSPLNIIKRNTSMLDIIKKLRVSNLVCYAQSTITVISGRRS